MNIDWKNRSNGKFKNRFADAYLGKELGTDMTFFIESENISIPAHSLIIAAASEVLDKLICGTGDIVNEERVVSVPNCTSKEFNILLHYLYTGKI